MLVLVWGEFGRSPRVNVNAGRDHWPEANFALFAGGGLRMGQVVGSTEKHGERPKTRPLGPRRYGDGLPCIGIDPSRTFSDHTGRPLPLLDNGKPIAELV